MTRNVTDIRRREAYNTIRRKYDGNTQPTSTLIVVHGLAHEDFLIEIDGIAAL